MKLKIYVVDLETPQWLRKLTAYAVPALTILGAGALVFAKPHQFVPNEPLMHQTMQDLNTIDTGLVKYSVGATKVCGLGAAPQYGSFNYNSLVGYAAAKALCKDSIGCMSPSAHMCTADEVARSMQLGSIGPAGLVPTTASYWYSNPAMAMVAGTNAVNTECNGWQANLTPAMSGAVYGPSVTFDSNGYPRPSPLDCVPSGAKADVLCCD